MKKGLPLVAAFLALGYLAPLSILPGANDGVQSFERQAWLVNLVMFCANVLGVVLLYRFKGIRWTALALLFCGFQVTAWWWFSGIRSVDGGFAVFFEQKLRATQALLAHSDVRVAIASLHQDIMIGLVYHLALAWLLVEMLLRRIASSQAKAV